MKFAITKKIGMSRIFDKDGENIAVTLLQTEKAKISRIKSTDTKDGYNAVVVEVESKKKNKNSSIYEFRIENPSEFKVGQEIMTEDLKESDEVTVESTAKGKGFAGTIKRYGFHRGPMTHGSHNIRQPGSIGGAYPQRVVPGKKMPGRMGGNNCTVKNLKIINVDAESNIIAVSGSVPGPTKGTVKIYTK